VALAIPPAGGDGAAELAELEAHAAAYAKLANERDSRNLPLLRTALRTERDPVLRMVAAEAAYLSDPDSATARRTFLENVTIDAQSFGRLRAISPSPGEPRVLGSLADLAAEGNAEALSLLVEVAAVARDPAGADALADLCAEVAASAPDELVEALRVASADGADAFVTALARGLVRARDPAHPFPPAVARAEVQGSPETAEFARVLGPRLAERTAAAEAALRAPPPASPLPVAPPARPPAAGEAEGRSGGG
jgi:D-alanyl-D-alanine carboxypeptidase/D-alanyl-D-alanine-endopeptidase (penicillin-binding protein 4)